jgi:SPP1 family predicted phage head-tail adaptor
MELDGRFGGIAVKIAVNRFNQKISFGTIKTVENNNTGDYDESFVPTISLHCALYNRSITQSYQILGTSLEDTIVVAIRSTNELSKQLLASYGDVVYQIIDVSKDSTGKPVAYDLLTLKKYVKKG